MKNLIGLLVVGTFPFLFAACGGDNSSNTVTWQSGQTSAVLNAVGDSVSQVNQSKVTREQSHLTHDQDLSPSSVNVTASCSGGGTVNLAGTLTTTTTGISPDTTTNLDYNYTIVFSECVSVGSDGQNYVLSGEGITVSGTSAWTVLGSAQNLSVSTDDNLTISGNVDVEGGQSASCDIDLSEQVSTSNLNGATDVSGSYTGTVCGQPENGTVSASVTANAT